VLILSMLLTRQDDQASILDIVANAVGSLGPCRTEGIFLDGRWQPVQVPAREAGPVSLPGVLPTADGHPAAAGGALVLGGVAWSWAYSLSGPHGPAGYLVVGAEARPAESERFLLRVLGQQTGVVLANARLHHRERERAAELLASHRALLRSVEIHDRLTRVAAGGEGQQGIARAVHELTDLPAAVEDRFGNLHAWAGPDPPRALSPGPRGPAEPAAGPGDVRGRAGQRGGNGWSRWPWSAGFRSGCWWCATGTGASATPNGWRSSTLPPSWPWSWPGGRAWPRATSGCGPGWCSTWSAARTGPRW
jgi:hypothetical protein